MHGVALGGRRRPAHPIADDRVPLVEAGDDPDLDDRAEDAPVDRRTLDDRPLVDRNREGGERHPRRLLRRPPTIG